MLFLHSLEVSDFRGDDTAGLQDNVSRQPQHHCSQPYAGMLKLVLVK